MRVMCKSTSVYIIYYIYFITLLNRRMCSVTYTDSGQKSFWDIGYDDSDEKANGRQPIVAKDQSDDEEERCHGNGDDDDQMNEVRHLAAQCR